MDTFFKFKDKLSELIHFNCIEKYEVINVLLNKYFLEIRFPTKKFEKRLEEFYEIDYNLSIDDIVFYLINGELMNVSEDMIDELCNIYYDEKKIDIKDKKVVPSILWWHTKFAEEVVNKGLNFKFEFLNSSCFESTECFNTNFLFNEDYFWNKNGLDTMEMLTVYYFPITKKFVININDKSKIKNMINMGLFKIVDIDKNISDEKYDQVATILYLLKNKKNLNITF